MGVPAAPHWQPQGPASRCVIQGHALGWLNCTPCSVAMAIEKATLSAKRPTACDIRGGIEPIDVAGGTTLPQCARVAERMGVSVDVYVGANVVPPFWAAVQLQGGRGIVLQGNTSALLGSPFRSTGTGVNHAVYVNQARGGALGEPAEALVFDPAADGRVAGWGKAAQGPQWWPWARVKAFAAALRPWGDGDPRVLGPGKWYCAVFPDTEPHAHFKYGAVRTSPFPDIVRVNVATLWSHSTPAYGVGNRIKPRLVKDARFDAYQRVSKSGTLWLGSHDGTRWVPASKVRNIGGSQ